MTILTYNKNGFFELKIFYFWYGQSIRATNRANICMDNYTHKDLTFLRTSLEAKVRMLEPDVRNPPHKHYNDLSSKLSRLHLDGNEKSASVIFNKDANILVHGDNPFRTKDDKDHYIRKFHIIEDAVERLLKEKFGQDYVYVSPFDEFENLQKAIAPEIKINEEASIEISPKGESQNQQPIYNTPISNETTNDLIPEGNKKHSKETGKEQKQAEKEAENIQKVDQPKKGKNIKKPSGAVYKKNKTPERISSLGDFFSDYYYFDAGSFLIFIVALMGFLLLLGIAIIYFQTV